MSIERTQAVSPASPVQTREASDDAAQARKPSFTQTEVGVPRLN